MPSVNRQQIETCPCNIEQAKLDISRFNPDPYCNTISTSADDNNMAINCIYHQDALLCIRIAFASDTGYDNECCYGKDGTLMLTDKKLFGGTALRYHFKGGTEKNVPYLSNIQNDVVPYMYCCQYLSEYQEYKYCTKYLQRRPASNCEGYIPLRPASTFGDPHLVTLDGLAYIFNGVGEFTLLQSTDENLIVQVRMEQFHDKDDQPKPASVITSVALRCETDSDVVEVRLNSIRLSDVLLNEDRLDFAERNSIDVKGSTMFNSKRNSSIGDLVWTLVSCRSLDIAFNITCMSKMININVVIGDQNLRGNIRGLLGNFNGKKEDDFTTFNDGIVSENSSLEDIHDIFGISWRTRPSDSLFTYPVGKLHETYQDVLFRPVLTFSENCISNSRSVCGNDDACLFDICTTRDVSLAKSTLVFSEEIQHLTDVAIPVCGEPDKIKNGFWIFSSNSANLKCNMNYNVSRSTQIECLDDGQWTAINTTCKLTLKPVTKSSHYKIWIKVGVPVTAVLVIVVLVFVVIRRRQDRRDVRKQVDGQNNKQTIKPQDGSEIPLV